MTIREFLSRLEGVKKHGDYWMACCPGHDDAKASLGVSEGDDGRVLLKCYAGCTPESVVAAMALTLADLFAEPAKPKRVIEATYDYEDEGGNLLFQAVRYNPKDFRQRGPDGNGGWVYNLEGVRRVLYRLPELIAPPDPETPVFLVEGEKDVDRLRAGGLAATCNPMGAGKWRDEYAEALAGRNVVIIPDNDQAGRDHAQTAARSLVGAASSVKMLELSGLPEKGDVSDWLRLGGTIETLVTMASNAPEWTDAPREETKADMNRAISWGELCEMKFPPRETILHETGRGEIIMFPAITGRGKTTLWRNIVLSLACGRAFPPVVTVGKPRKILYLDFETRLPQVRADVTTMLGELSVAERRMISENFHVISDCRVDGRSLSLSNPKHRAFVAGEAKRIGADVIVVDTITRAFALSDENSSAEATRVADTLTEMAVLLNCVVVFLHHIGKQKSEEGQTAQAAYRGRGSSAFPGCAHSIWTLLADNPDLNRSTLECSKVKGRPFPNTTLTLDAETRWFTASGAAEKPVSAYDKVIGVFNGHPLKRAAVLEKLDGWKTATVDRYLKEGLERDDLEKLPGGTYQKKQKPQNPIPYRGDKNGVFSQPADIAEDSLNFEDFDQDNLAEYSDCYLDAIDR